MAQPAKARVKKTRRLRLIEHATHCALCGGLLPLPDQIALVDRWLAPTIDHILEASEGGSAAEDNLQVVHYICNCLRGCFTQIAQLIPMRYTLGLPPIPTHLLRTIPMQLHPSEVPGTDPLAAPTITLIGQTLLLDGERRVIQFLMPGSTTVDGDVELYDLIVSDPVEQRRLYKDLTLVEIEEKLRPTPEQRDAMGVFMMQMRHIMEAYTQGKAGVEEIFQATAAEFEKLGRPFAEKE